MVKNTKGGGNAKKQGRKYQTDTRAPTNAPVRLAEDGEEYAIVMTMYGNGMCQVLTYTGKSLMCHIRGKFRGRFKKHNFISKGSWILVGLRSWEDPVKNCDLDFVYDDHDMEQLKTNSALDLQVLLAETVKNQTHGASEDTSNMIDFADNVSEAQEAARLMQEQLQSATNKSMTVRDENGSLVDFEDI